MSSEYKTAYNKFITEWPILAQHIRSCAPENVDGLIHMIFTEGWLAAGKTLED